MMPALRMQILDGMILFAQSLSKTQSLESEYPNPIAKLLRHIDDDVFG